MNDDKFFQAALAVVVLFIVGVFLKLARPVLIPFILAVFLSYIVDPALTFLTRCRCPRPGAVVAVLALMFVFLYLVGVLVFTSGKALVAELPKYQERLRDLAGLLDRGLGGFEIDVSTALRSLDIEKIGSALLKTIGPFLGFIGKLLLVFLFLAFIVAGRGRAEAKFLKAVRAGDGEKLRAVLERINLQIRTYLVIKTAVSLANGLIVWIVLEAFGVDFAALFGVLAFALNFVPSIGSLVGTVVIVGFAFFQFGTFWTPFWILVITASLDTLVGNIVEPRVMGRGLGLSPLLVFFALLFWGWLWGIPGMILSVPLTAVIKIVCQNVPGLKPVSVLMGS